MTDTPLSVGLLLYPNCMPAGLIAFKDLLEAANLRAGRRHFHCLWVASQQGAVICAHGQSLHTDSTLNAKPLDILIIPGAWSDSTLDIAHQLAAATDIIQDLKHLPTSTQCMSYCTGVALLAASGRLNHQLATATWWLTDYVETHFPEVNWQCQLTHTEDERAATASGVHGYLLLAEQLIQTTCSREVFQDISQLMILPRPQNSVDVFQSIGMMQQQHSLLRRLQLVVEQLPATQLNSSLLAAELTMTSTTLSRKVKSLSGYTLAHYVRLIKLNQASQLLLYSDLSLLQICDRLGYSDESSFRRTFRQVSGYSPREYQQQFRR